jgi:hypothetical protein
MLNDDSSKNDHNMASSSSHTPSTELAYLPIGCSVSAKYRGAFCTGKIFPINPFFFYFKFYTLSTSESN